jgi:hypothetical protein
MFANGRFPHARAAQQKPSSTAETNQNSSMITTYNMLNSRKKLANLLVQQCNHSKLWVDLESLLLQWSLVQPAET